MNLSNTELARYSRHLLLPEVGLSGQKKLLAARVLLVGMGGLGCPAALYLAAAGVGTLGLVDFDVVDVSNLQRQVIYTTEDIGASKVENAAAALSALNGSLDIRTHELKISATNVLALVEAYDIVIDGSDNFTTRYLLNDACVLARKPYVYGAILRFEGQASVFTHTTGCYRCLFPKPPEADAVPNCAEAGVLGVLPGTIGLIQATETVKLILEVGETLAGKLLLYDALSVNFEKLHYKRNAKCPVCGDNPTICELVEESVVCAAQAEQQTISAQPEEISVEQLSQRLADAGRGFVLLDVRSSEEHAICNLPSALLIPLPELDKRFSELDKSKEIIVYCKSGKRSATASQLLRQHGYRAKSLSGGITAWARQCDPSMAVY